MWRSVPSMHGLISFPLPRKGPRNFSLADCRLKKVFDPLWLIPSWYFWQTTPLLLLGKCEYPTPFPEVWNDYFSDDFHAILKIGRRHIWNLIYLFGDSSRNFVASTPEDAFTIITGIFVTDTQEVRSVTPGNMLRGPLNTAEAFETHNGDPQKALTVVILWLKKKSCENLLHWPKNPQFLNYPGRSERILLD